MLITCLTVKFRTVNNSQAIHRVEFHQKTVTHLKMVSYEYLNLILGAFRYYLNMKLTNLHLQTLRIESQGLLYSLANIKHNFAAATTNIMTLKLTKNT